VAPGRAHTRANQERPLATPVSEPEKIIRSGKALQRQTSISARASRPGISRNTSSFVSREPLVESTSVETSSSHKIVILSEILNGDEPSISFDLIDPISEHITISNLGEEVVESIQEEDSSSSLNSSQTKPGIFFFYTHTSFPILEDILQYLFSKGEEKFAFLLSQFYRDSYFPPCSDSEVKPPSLSIVSPILSQSSST